VCPLTFPANSPIWAPRPGAFWMIQPRACPISGPTLSANSCTFGMAPMSHWKNGSTPLATASPNQRRMLARTIPRAPLSVVKAAMNALPVSKARGSSCEKAARKLFRLLMFWAAGPPSLVTPAIRPPSSSI
jgi:hypothetical protein